MCKEWIAKPTTQRYPGLKEVEKDRKCTPIIADMKSSLNKALFEIKVGNKQVLVLNKTVNSLKYEDKSMSQVKEMINIWMEENRTVVLLIQDSKKLKERLRIVEQKVRKRVELKRKL